jgi:hypothetical protein
MREFKASDRNTKWVLNHRKGIRLKDIRIHTQGQRWKISKNLQGLPEACPATNDPAPFCVLLGQSSDVFAKT